MLPRHQTFELFGPVENNSDLIAFGRRQGLRGGVLDHQEAFAIRVDVEVSKVANIAPREQLLRLPKREGRFSFDREGHYRIAVLIKELPSARRPQR